MIQEFSNLHKFQAVIPISARKRDGLDVLLQKLIESLPEGPRYFPEDQVTDQPARFMAAESIREQILLETSEEIPYSVTVLIDGFEEGKKLTRISATIYCEREGQKGDPDRQGRSDAEKNWHGGEVTDREDGWHPRISGIVCKSPARLA